ncbi:MAG: hypothetical protein HQ541_08415 [Mariniphaga sp.]|nr:hypothetical protein [Mariniphaga sp.]
MKRHFQIIFIFFLVAASFNFFDARFLPEGLPRIIQFLSAVAAIALSIPFALRKWEGFVAPVHLMMVAIFFSIIACYLSWGQGFVGSIKSTAPFALWIFVFYLLQIKIPVRTIENLVLVYAGIYVVLYFFQLVNTRNAYFGGNETIEQVRGISRIIFPGAGVFFLGAFIGVNRFTSMQGTIKLIWVPLILLGLLIPFLQVTRQLIVAVAFLYLVHFTRKLDFVKKTIILLTFIAGVVFINLIDLEIIEGLKDAQEKTATEGLQNIRLLSGTYFLTEFSPNLITKIFGNGVPFGEEMEYGQRLHQLAIEKNYFLTDVGVVAVYILFGVLGIIAFALIWIKSFKYKVPNNYTYLKYYLWMLLITSITSDNLFSRDYLMATVLAIYIFQRVYIQEKEQNNYPDFFSKKIKA